MPFGFALPSIAAAGASLFGANLPSFIERLGGVGQGIAGIGNILGRNEANREQAISAFDRRALRRKLTPFFLDPSRSGSPFAGLDQGFQDILGDIENFGAGRRASIEQGSKERTRSAQAQLAGRGLGSSVLLDSVTRGGERDRQLLLGELDDTVLGARINARSQNQNRGLQQQRLLAQLIG